MISKEEAFNKLSELVTRFREQIDDYKRSDYNETLTRRDFIDPFFEALGWDVDNSQGFAEAYREVIHEDRVKVGKNTKAPDYSFRLPGGKRLFFVEAKKPGVSVKEDISVAYQIRRYGWSAKLAVSIITDFEEFSVYDCNIKPKPSDQSAVARVKYLRYTDYLREFDFLWDTFSKERVLKGSFDRYLCSESGKRGTATVDKEFLISLDNWRTYLATNISLRNKELDEDEINFVVQLTIDRLIFLRIAEDRGVEPYGQLNASVNQKGDTWQNLFYNFRCADEKYNSGLFDMKKDKLSGTLHLDNKVLKTIVKEMYYPECSYEFSVFSVEILGSAYEQFLGKVIRIDKAHRAKIEEKPEVRKAGGVYYTPQYIVDFIVKNTVGTLVEGKSPKEVEKIRIVDPACGSGSFLLGAYQFLLDFHKDYYTQNGIKPGKKDSPVTMEGNLTSAEKKRILLNNIYGVDIDVNAVEVTKLSLLLKCLEGETEITIAQQQQLWHERILPTLDNNIKSGNSLIDIDFYGSQLDFGEEKKIKPFNWEKTFPDVFNRSGFDIVIGNPPYVRQELLGAQKGYFESHYRIYHGMADLYSYFIEKGIRLLKEDGLFGIIVANKWMRANYGEPLRKWLKEQTIYQILDFGDLPVFESATTYPCILIAGKPKDENKSFLFCPVKTLKLDSLSDYVEENSFDVDKKDLDVKGWNLAGGDETALLQKIKSKGIPLGEYVSGNIYYGIKTGLNEAFVIDAVTRERLIAEDPRSQEVIKPFLAGRDIKRYQTPVSDKYLIFFPKGFTNLHGMFPKNGWKWLFENYRTVAAHLEPYKEKAEKRYDKGDFWWELRACDYYAEFEKPKILLPDIALSMQALYDDTGFYCVNTAYIIPFYDKKLIGILNSKVIQYFYSSISNSIRGGYLRFIRQYLEQIPISDFSTNIDLENMVELMIQLHKEMVKIKVPDKAEQLKLKIDFAQNSINNIVYQLYGLTEDEIRIIEENLK